MQYARFHPQALKEIRSFPRSARFALGEAIRKLEYGVTLGMPLSRPMSIVGPGVHELRVKDANGIYRAFYIVKSAHGVFVFHAFVKKTQQTPQREIELAIKRLRESGL